MVRYHFSPETGNAGICRAKVSPCPYFSDGYPHFDTINEARKGAEEFFANPPSEATRLVVMRSRIHKEINIRFAENPQSYSDLKPLIKIRDDLDKRLWSLHGESSSDARDLSLSEGIMSPVELNVDHGDRIEGVENNLAEAYKTFEASITASTEISEQWLNNLSSSEVKTLLEYSGRAATANGRAHILDEIIRKAPPFKEIIVYSGLSSYVAEDVIRQADSERIKLDYPISTSLNAAQVNGFMQRDPEGRHIALEIVTREGGSMAAVSHSPHEFEVLLTSGEYEVLEKRTNVMFLWGENGAGRKADVVLKLRKI